MKIKHLRHEYSSLIFCKIRKKNNKNKRQSITCSHIWHFDILVLIRYTISESLVDIQQFRHAWSIIIYENTQKCNKIKVLAITACRYTKICVLIRPSFCERLQMPPIIMLFLDILQCCRFAQGNGLTNQKFGSVRINYNNIPNF